MRPFWAILGPSWGHPGASWGPLAASWGRLGASWDRLWAFLSPLGAILGLLGAILGPSWGYLEAILGLSWGDLIAILRPLGTSWRHLGVSPVPQAPRTRLSPSLLGAPIKPTQDIPGTGPRLFQDFSARLKIRSRLPKTLIELHKTPLGLPSPRAPEGSHKPKASVPGLLLLLRPLLFFYD